MTDYSQGDSMEDFIKEDVEDALDSSMIKSNKSDIENLPESPNSANIKVWIDGFGVMFTMRDNQMSNVVKKVTTLIQLAKEKSWQPSWEVKILPKTTPTTATPVCGVHGSTMEWKSGISKKTGKPYAFWSCPVRNNDGSWCSFTPPKV